VGKQGRYIGAQFLLLHAVFFQTSIFEYQKIPFAVAFCVIHQVAESGGIATVY
jgi:hypothetical protein